MWRGDGRPASLLELLVESLNYWNYLSLLELLASLLVEKDKTGKIDISKRQETTTIEHDDHYIKRRKTFCSETSCPKYSDVQVENPTTMLTEPNADQALNTVFKTLTDFSETTQNSDFVFDPKYFPTGLSKIMHRVVTSLADVINRQTAWIEKLTN